MGLTKKFNPAGIVVSVVANLISGWDTDTFAEFTPEAAVRMDEVGADGEVLLIENLDKRATLKLTLLQSSASNDVLSALANAGAIGAGLLKDLNGSTDLAWAQCWVSELPSVSFSKGKESRVWVIRIGSYSGVIGGNNVAV